MTVAVLSSRLLASDELESLTHVLHFGWMRAGDRDRVLRLLATLHNVGPGEAIRVQRVRRPEEPDADE